MNLSQAILLGVLQGLTEFIPISSSGHLILAEKLMGLDQQMSAQQITAFIAVMQLGTLLAVVTYFARDVVGISLGFLRGTWWQLLGKGDSASRSSSQMGWLIILGTVPIGVVGILAKRLIEGEETKNPLLIGTSLIVWALLLWAADRFGRQRLEMADLGWKQALIVGVAQVFALIPGSSRSGTTITGALFAGMSRETAARFSFLLSIPAIGASGLIELGEATHLLDEAHRLHLFVATAVSAVVGYASIAFLLNYLRQHTTTIFVVYRLLLGLVVLIVASR
ncbi:MAG: undecaprenyl-diphosphatase UppP [Blastocatellia bacterium]